jgi:hypothetical protein
MKSLEIAETGFSFRKRKSTSHLAAERKIAPASEGEKENPLSTIVLPLSWSGKLEIAISNTHKLSPFAIELESSSTATAKYILFWEIFFPNQIRPTDSSTSSRCLAG